MLPLVEELQRGEGVGAAALEELLQPRREEAEVLRSGARLRKG